MILWQPGLVFCICNESLVGGWRGSRSSWLTGKSGRGQARGEGRQFLLAMNDGKYFSFSTMVMNAPCYIPFESTLFFGELAEQAQGDG